VGSGAPHGQVADQRGHGGDVRDVVDQGGEQRRPEQQPGGRDEVAVADGLGGGSPDAVDHADLHQPTHHHEQPHEEDQRGPLDVVEVGRRFQAGDQDRRARAEQGDEGGFHV
jgi:hypothetical protein